MSTQRFAGKVMVVTGAAQGIGRAVALRTPLRPEQDGEARVTADWIPHRIVFIKGSDRSRC